MEIINQNEKADHGSDLRVGDFVKLPNGQSLFLVTNIWRIGKTIEIMNPDTRTKFQLPISRVEKFYGTLTISYK